MNDKSKTAKNQANTENKIENIISKEELDKKIESVMKELKSSTWRELETNGKFTKNDKLTFISDEMLIIGCDIGCETHYIRAVDARGRELSRGAFALSNNSEGFESAKQWALELAAANGKKQIVLGLEPTDCAEPKSIADLKDNEIWFARGCYKKPGCVNVRIKWLQHRKRIFDPRRTPNAYRKFSTYSYDIDKNGIVLSQVPDKDNHTIDATAYGLDPVIFRRGHSA